MRTIGHQPRGVLLPGAGGNAGESGLDASDRRVAFGASVLRKSSSGSAAGKAGISGQSQANQPVDAGDGHRGDLSEKEAESYPYQQPRLGGGAGRGVGSGDVRLSEMLSTQSG